MDLNHPLLANLTDDPPPFPDTQPQLQRLDKSVFCQICKDLFQGPVTILCGHSFCSECIRSSLDAMTDKKCPLCHMTVSEASIRRNRALEEITDAWEGARPTLITLSQPVAGPSRRRHLAAEPMSKTSSSTSATGPRKRPRRSGSGEGRTSRGTSRSQSPVKVGKAANGHVENLLSSDMEDELESDDEIEEISENDEGECPICSAKMPISAIPMHIERGCPPVAKKTVASSGNQKADWKKVFSMAGNSKEKSTPMKRMTKPNYSLASPADLRAILNEYSLPTTGDKSTLQARVQQWIILYNSNLDTEHPRSLSALRAKLSENEASRKRDKDKGRDEAVEKLRTKEGFAQYVKQSGSEFDRLRREIMERDAKRVKAEKGREANNAIEVD